MTKDETYAAKFVKNAQHMNDTTSAKDAPLTAEKEILIKEEIYAAMLYKSGSVDVGLC